MKNEQIYNTLLINTLKRVGANGIKITMEIVAKATAELNALINKDKHLRAIFSHEGVSTMFCENPAMILKCLTTQLKEGEKNTAPELATRVFQATSFDPEGRGKREISGHGQGR